jgi:hypothetical protein
MKALVTLLGLSLACLPYAIHLKAQDTRGPCPNVYPMPRVGHYAEVVFSNPQGERMPIRFAIVGEEEVGGVPHYWIEVVSVPPAIGAEVIVQMLVPYYPFENADIADYVVKMPGQPAQRVPKKMLDALGDTEPGPGWKDQCATAEDLGMEPVTVSAGTFNAHHYRAGGERPSEVWIAEVPFGMVKLVESDGEMELVEYGADAKSSITEKPIDIELPPGGPGGSERQPSATRSKE